MNEIAPMGLIGIDLMGEAIASRLLAAASAWSGYGIDPSEPTGSFIGP